MAPSSSHSQPRDISEPHLETARLRFRNLLLATDFSPAAESAAQIAMSFAQLFGSNAVSVHALPPILFTGEGSVDPSILEAAEESARLRLKKLGAEMGMRSIKHQEVISSVPAITAIQEAANTHHAELVIVGSHGAHGLEKLILGSVAEGILRNSHVPVMIIGPNCKSGPSPFKSILLATDLGIGSLRPAQYAASIAEETAGRLTLVHVESDMSKVSESARKEVQERLKHLVPAGADLWCHSDVRVEVGSPSAQIVNAALAEEADLIVVGTREAGLLSNHAPWSTISKIIRGATCPVLAVPAHSN